LRTRFRKKEKARKETRLILGNVTYSGVNSPKVVTTLGAGVDGGKGAMGEGKPKVESSGGAVV
jgi:hypothetical protein